VGGECLYRNKDVTIGVTYGLRELRRPPDTRRRIRFALEIGLSEKSDGCKLVASPSDKSLKADDGSAIVSRETHERPGQEWHPEESANIISLGLRANEQVRARQERYPIENSDDPTQSPYAPKKKKQPPQSNVARDFAISEDAPHRTSEGLGEDVERGAIGSHESKLLSRDTPGCDQQELDDSEQSPKKELTQSAVEEDFAIGEAGAPRASEGLREHFGRRAVNIHEPSLVSSDANGEQQELDRLATSVRAVQREEVAARLPRAAQLASLRGVAPIDRGSWPPRTPAIEDLAPPTAIMLGSDSLRGPSTVIKVITLIVSMFAVPVAYYFWVGGWDPIANPPPENAQLISNSMVGPPKPSTQAVTTSAQDDDDGTPAKGEPEAAKSFARESVATIQSGTLDAQDPPSSTAVRQLDPEQIKLLIKRGEQFIAAGDMVTARLAFQRAAEAGNANAALALGATYDPTVLTRFGVVGINADVREARSWYRKAKKLGSPEAGQRLEVLADR